MTDIYKYDDYRSYIEAQIAANSTIRGYRKQLATVAKCQPSYLSQALNHQVELTPDHVARLGNFWNLSSDEVEFFLQLCYLSRCGSASYRAVISRRLQELRKQRDDLTKQLSYNNPENEQDLFTYYSSWYPVALHILFSLPEVHSMQQAAKRLNAPEHLIQTYVDKLIKMKLLEVCDGKIRCTNAAVHMDKHSSLSSMHHLNWRHKVVESFCPRQPEDLHYTGVHSLSASDLAKLKIKINRLLTEFNGSVSTSPEERVAVVVMDVFEL